ncbi:hypothetical protein BS47DRAFT_1398517 [Hydnum rufescens UP504]|uniref:Uncharacterized protein n=1 Tax=Hydnum rufescens UP504 TaxID=1448309 RepID=A0A9P6ALI8_9AGAM|nr:hypothetical protein BS47DRAFT_1398517 [Hydnum rufescens UP504]
MVWMKFAPAQYNTTYFVYEEELQEWHMDWELLITVQTGIERLQNIISDVITIRIEELKMADKLLKLWVELTFVGLYKLKKLHQGESLSTPMASEDSLPPMPELKERLHKDHSESSSCGLGSDQGRYRRDTAYHTGDEASVLRNQALKYAEYDMNLEEALDVQPLPRVDTDRMGWASSSKAQNSRSQAWMRLGNSSTFHASSIDLDASPSTWQDIPLYDSLSRESATPTPNPTTDSHPLAMSFYSRRGIEECSVDPRESAKPE